MPTYTWYAQLLKPMWAPPSWLFGPVWTVLYLIIFVTFGSIFYKAFTKEIPWMIALPFALNIFFNIIFTPLQFGLKNNLLASLDILLIVGTLIWALIGLWNFSQELRWIVYLNIPYLIWGSFATALQVSVTYLNK